jgi:hypothetical protein
MSTLNVSKVSGALSSSWGIDVDTNSHVHIPGSVLQTIYVRSDALSTYASAITGEGTTIGDLAITITPRSSSSLLLCTWMINCEVNQNNVFLVHKNGVIITTPGYQGFNSEYTYNRYSGIASAMYDNNDATTMSNHYIQYAVPAISTSTAIYAPAIRASGATAYTLFLNRSVNAPAAAVEISVSSGMIQEIAQ